MNKSALVALFMVFPALSNSYWDEVFAATERARKAATTISQPIEAELSSDFGYRFHPIKHAETLHRGVDFAAPEGSVFYAAKAGVVEYAEERGDLGLTIAIRHNDGSVTRYGHAQQSLVKAGDLVAHLAPIGHVGKTGNVTGPHLHFELIVNGEHVDPTAYSQVAEGEGGIDYWLSKILSSQQRELLGEREDLKSQDPLSLQQSHATDATKPAEVSVWKKAAEISKQTGYSIYQTLYVIEKLNPRAFKAGNVNFHYADQHLEWPSKEQVVAHAAEPDEARHWFFENTHATEDPMIQTNPLPAEAGQINP